MRLTLGALGLSVGLLAGCQSSGGSATVSPPSSTAKTEVATTEVEGQTWADVVERLRPGVVRVQVTACDGSEAVGSGFVIDGWVVSNRHVIEGYAAINVITSDGKETIATEVRGSPSDDLALIKVPVSNPLSWATKTPRVAEDVAALGFPRGIGFSFTKGSLSALDVEMMNNGRPLRGLLQTDTAVNPGNSGGPLINRNGEVVGVVVLKRTDSEGLAFAIEAGRARTFVSSEGGDEVAPCQAGGSNGASTPTTVPAAAAAADSEAAGDVAPDGSDPSTPSSELPNENESITQGPERVVKDFYEAVRSEDFKRAWELGGKNLGKIRSFEKFTAGYAGTKTTNVKIVDVTGTIVTVQVLAVEDGSDGVQVSTYRGTYDVRNNEIVSGRLTLESRE